MKKANLFQSLIVVLILSGCGGGGKNQQSSTLESIDSVAMAGKMASPCKEGSRESNPEHLISMSDAGNYLWKFYSKYKELSERKGAMSDISKGDYDALPVTYLDESLYHPDKTASYHCGLLLYYYENSGKFYLAYKKVGALPFPVTLFPIPSPSEIKQFNLSQCAGLYPSTDFGNQADLMSFVTSNANLCTETLINVSEEDINTNSELFANNFVVSGSTENPAIAPLAFFHTSEIDQVTAQEGCNGLRLFLGYDDNEDSHKIKIIIFGIDKDGKIISSETAKILERSWPPV